MNKVGFVILILLTTNLLFAQEISLKSTAQALLSPKMNGKSRKVNPTSTPKIVANFYIKFYQKHISPQNGNSCVFRPTCSEYARQAIAKHGFFKGIILSTDRLTRCHSKAFYDSGYKRTKNGFRHDPIDKK
jgi:hypothetical protein